MIKDQFWELIDHLIPSEKENYFKVDIQSKKCFE